MLNLKYTLEHLGEYVIRAPQCVHKYADLIEKLQCKIFNRH